MSESTNPKIEEAPRSEQPATTTTTPGSWLSRLRGDRFLPVVAITIALFALSPLLAPGSLSPSALSAMLPFAAIMAIAALGQTLVIAHGGIDLSVPGVMALAAVFATKVAQNGSLPLGVCVLLGIASGAISGLLVGIAVVRFRVAAFVATLAVNSLLLGIVLILSDGFPGTADPALSSFAVSSVLGVPSLFLVAIVVVALGHILLRHSAPGRRFIAVGAGVPAARMLGLRTAMTEISAYVLAGGAYAVAGTLLAAYLRTPDLRLGDSYQLTTIAAVVLGGSLLRGGISSIAATAVAAVFLTQLGQVVLAAGASTAMQLLVQAVVLAVAVVARGIPWRTYFRRPAAHS